MRFKLISAASCEWCDNPKLYEAVKPFCEVEGDNLFIDAKYICELKTFLFSLSDDLYENTYGWKPSEVIIDFKYNEVTLRDYYIE